MEKRKAFTLIELMGVLVIIGILTVILVPVINNTIKNNKQKLHDNQIDMIRLSAQNLATDNTYILPEEDGEEIYITLGQLRAMGYAEETIIDPLTNKNFPDNLIVMIIKKGNDYDYVINLDGGTIITSSGITVGNPSKKYINKGASSSYIITAKTASTMEKEQVLENYINIGKENIKLLEVGETDEKVKYKLDGNNGLYKLTVLGGDKNGYLYFSLNNLKDYEGKEIDVSTTNNDINSNKKIIVDNERLKCNWSGENTEWTNKEVSIVLTGSKNESDGRPKAPMKGSNKTQTYNENGKELKNDNLSFDIEDEAGNVTTCSKIVNVYYDTKKPVITSIDNPTNGNWVNYDFSVKLNTTEEGSGLQKVYYSYPSKPEWTKEDASIDGNIVTSTPFSAERNELAYFNVCDRAGNCSEKASTLIRIDKTAPTVPTLTAEKLYQDKNVGTYANDTWTNNDVKIKYSSTDSGVGEVYYQYSHNGSNWISNSSNNGFASTNTSWKISWDSVFDYYIRACDGLNNCSLSSKMTIKIDKTAPKITKPYQAGCLKVGQEKISFTVEDASPTTFNYKYQYNPKSEGCKNIVPKTYKLDGGTNTFVEGFQCLSCQIKISEIYAIDAAGNKSTISDTEWLNRTCSR